MTKEERRARQREYSRKWRQEHPEKARENTRKWQREHPAYMRNYRAKQRGKEGAVPEYIPEGCVYPDCERCPLEDCMREGV